MPTFHGIPISLLKIPLASQHLVGCGGRQSMNGDGRPVRRETLAGPTKMLFVSSTVVDLREERRKLKNFLETHSPIPLTCLLSEGAAFPVPPRMVSAHPYDIALDNLCRSDFVIQLINQRYGVADIDDAGDRISITHKEYRETFRLRLPLYTFVRRDLWDAFGSWKRGQPQHYVPNDQLGVFHLLDETQNHARKRWLFFWSNISEIEQDVTSSLFGHDESRFVGDISIPDGTIVRVNERFEKVWELKNIGFATWRERWLREENPGNGLTPETSRVAVPETPPGSSAVLRVNFTAPKYPATCDSYWKMVDSNGRHCFPWMKGVWCRVKVVY